MKASESAENYSVATMDREHAGQLNLFNDLKAAIRGGAPDSLVYVLLDQLVEHTSVHFLSEQLAMKLHAYEASESHLLEHQRLLAELRSLKSNLAMGKPADKHGLVEALRGWMVAHIETADKALTEHLASRTVSPK